MYRKIILLITIMGVISVAQATDVTYTCCKNFTTNEGTLINKLDTSTYWTKSALGSSTLGTDNTHFIEGTGSVYLNTGNSTTAQARNDTNFSFGVNKTISMWAYSDDWDRVSGVSIYYMYDLTDTKYIAKEFLNITFSNGGTNDSGWVHFVGNTKQFSWASMNVTDKVSYVRIKVRAVNTSQPANVSFDNHRIGFISRPKAIITMDDGSYNQSALGYPILTALGFRAQMFVPVTAIGSSPTAITSAQLDSLHTAGWDISPHGYEHGTFVPLNNTTLIHELNDSFDYYYARGYHRSAWFTAYPGGEYNGNVLDHVKSRFLLSRSVNVPTWSANPEPHDYDTMNLRLPVDVLITNPADVIQAINDTIDRNGSYEVVFHGLHNEETDGGYYNISKFQTIVSYLKTRSSDIDTITYSDLLIKNVPNNTVIKNNKTTTIYANGTSQITYDNYEEDEIADMVIVPSNASVYINISRWDTSGSYQRNWLEGSATHDVTTLHIISGLPTGNHVDLYIDGIYESALTVNGTGTISFNYAGGYTEHNFEIIMSSSTTGSILSIGDVVTSAAGIMPAIVTLIVSIIPVLVTLAVIGLILGIVVAIKIIINKGMGKNR